MLVQGNIQDRPWGKTLGALGRRAVTGQLAIRSGSDTYIVVFDGGHVVAAAAPEGTITLLGIALAQDVLDVARVAELERMPEAERERALADQIAPDLLLKLRRQTIAGAVTRTFALAEGTFDLAPEVTLAVAPHTAMHVGGLIYHGALAHLDDHRLATAVTELGTTFRTFADGIPDLQYFGFGESELVVVRALAQGISLHQIDQLPAAERRIARATVYTLASLGVLHCEPAIAAAATDAPRIARGTGDPMPPGPALARTASGGIPRPSIRASAPAIPRVPTPQTLARSSVPSLAAARAPRGTEPPDSVPALVKKGQAALRDDRLEDAILALARAVELAPDNAEAKTALAWARFCHAPNKPQAAEAARQVLGQLALRGDRPVVAYYYLGMVERIVGRTSAALSHFQQVLELDPNHREATTELRFLSRPSGPIKR